MATAIRYGVDLMGGDGGYFLRPWVHERDVAEPWRGEIVGPIPSKRDAEELQAGLLAGMKEAVERSLRDLKLTITRSSPAREWRPGDEAKPFQWPEE
jgi:hypothetical protein